MIETWYAILSFMLLMFVVLEGFDIGAGMLQFIVGKTEAERRTIIAAIGPLWTWHEVWLVGFGGTLLLAFPAIFAATFAGFYLALFLLLWSLVLRGVSIEMSGHIADPLWRSAWDFCFVAANVLLAILIGAALANVVRGVPVGPDGKFSLPFFTNFRPRGEVGILDWYTVSVAVFILLTFALHGATGLAKRTEGPVRERSLRIARILCILTIAWLAIVTMETWQIRSELYSNMIRQPLGWFGLICVVAGILNVFMGLERKQDTRALIGSNLFIAGLMIAGAVGVFPFMLRSTVSPQYSISAYAAAAEGHGLRIALVWWPVALTLSFGYFFFIFRHYSGKVTLAQDTQTPY
jgi:cytochrome bd ubiquinol oxidase subunit II